MLLSLYPKARLLVSPRFLPRPEAPADQSPRPFSRISMVSISKGHVKAFSSKTEI